MTAKQLGQLVVIVVIAALAVAACSFSIGGQSVADAAVELISGEFSDANSIALTDVECSEPPADDVGTTFGCQAVHQGRTVDFEVLIDRKDHITVSSTNIVYVPVLQAIEQTVAESMNDQGDFGLTADSVDCGESPIVLDDDSTFVCGLVEPGTDNVFDTTIRVTDLANVVFDFEVATSPR